MKTEDIPTAKVSPWVPEGDLERLGLCLKLAEEACELAGRCCRAAMQGLDAADPGDGRLNRQHIEDEIADIYALTAAYRDRIGVNEQAMMLRADRKEAFKRPWFNFLRSISPRKVGQ